MVLSCRIVAKNITVTSKALAVAGIDRERHFLLPRTLFVNPTYISHSASYESLSLHQRGRKTCDSAPCSLLWAPSMLSRSNSNAAERLRRAKSTSSTQTSSSGHGRTSTSIDPFVVRQQAEVAAAEAFRRTQPLHDPIYSTARATRPAPQRRKSQRTGRAEGSHFEDARVRRYRSTSTRPDNKAARSSTARVEGVTESKPVDNASGEEKIITRKRSVIPPIASQDRRHSDFLAPPLTNHGARKVQSVYADGSPTPRHASTAKHQSLTLPLPSSALDNTDGYGGQFVHLSDFGEPTLQSAKSPGPSIRETQTDEEILAMARDRCLLEFQQKKVRERKSILLAPFQKRRATTSLQQSTESDYDTRLPPFNYAGDLPLPPLPHALGSAPAAPTAVHSRRETRSFSNTLKGRFKKVFRKASKLPIELPVQHVEAKHFHYAASEEAYHSLSEKQADPFTVYKTDTPTAMSAPTEKNASGNSRTSASHSSDAKSRVTSWANSTVAGTCASRLDPDRPDPIDEHGGLRRSGSSHTLRKASSFFGRPVRNKLRRASKAELKSSEESQALYSALQNRMKPAVRTETPDNNVDDRSQHCALASLPSQRAPSSSLSSRGQCAASTIRSVTPDPAAYRLSVPSPVPEALSPDTVAPQRAKGGQNDEPAARTLRVSTWKAPPPSQEQIARRLEKSKNRWQSPLDELSPAVPHSSRAAMMDDNPYELRSLSQSLQQSAAAGSDLPHHAKVSQGFHDNAQNMLSPSVYSRATDGASPRPLTPVDGGGTMVKVTGREVRSYSISPAKHERTVQRAVQTSGQWRRWLSEEMSAFGSHKEVKNAGNDVRKDTYASAWAQPACSGALFDELDDRLPVLPALDARPPSATMTARPKASSRRSSFMNERYPMLDGDRNSSEQSVASRNVSSSQPPERPGSSDPSLQRPSVDSRARKASYTKPHIVSGRQSIARMETVTVNANDVGAGDYVGKQSVRGNAALASEHEAGASSDKTKSSTQGRPKATAKHKSAFELRANFRSGNTGRSTPVEIRRKSPRENSNTADILEDTTIRNISAGPYAAQPTTVTTTKPPARSNQANKENTPPSSEANSLPALSSSEWLAAGGGGGSKASAAAVHPAHRNRSVSRYSPGRPKGSGQQGGSPAQRMASQWLEKRSRETTPAFV